MESTPQDVREFSIGCAGSIAQSLCQIGLAVRWVILQPIGADVSISANETCLARLSAGQDNNHRGTTRSDRIPWYFSQVYPLQIVPVSTLIYVAVLAPARNASFHPGSNNMRPKELRIPSPSWWETAELSNSTTSSERD